MVERRRLWALDGLRGLAALAVVAYHYLDRGPHLYPVLGSRNPWVEWGQYGVQLFFMISGFVIFDSVRYSTTGKFFAYRVIRLYPAYWVAVILTFFTVSVFGLPGRETPLHVAFVNLTMLQGFINVQHVDGAYWTLAIELTFYIVIALLARTRALADRWIFWTLVLWLGISVTLRAAAVVLKGIVALEILGSIAYWMPVFIVGIALNVGYSTGRWSKPAALIVASICAVAPGNVYVVVPLMVATALTLSAIFIALPEQVRPLSDYLGELSYPIYLVHQNIGYVALLALASYGVPQYAAVLITAAAALTLATLISYKFDIPVRRRLRGLVANRFKGSSPS